MRFKISHETVYRYGSPASESVGELRLFPRDTRNQTISNRQLQLDPPVPVRSFEDFFGNTVETFAVPFRHSRLRVRMTADVETRAPAEAAALAAQPVAQVGRLDPGRLIDVYPFLMPTLLVPLGGLLKPLKLPRLQDRAALRKAVLDLNGWIHREFAYMPGTTDISTPLEKVIAGRRGVCQDFAHLMLAILRTGGIPARYVSGYIEPRDPTAPGGELVGAAASHAWVEVLLADGSWWGLDPTNNQGAGERHVVVAVGRDYHDVAPLRGTYKGAQNQKLRVMVSMRRKVAAK